MDYWWSLDHQKGFQYYWSPDGGEIIFPVDAIQAAQEILEEHQFISDSRSISANILNSSEVIIAYIQSYKNIIIQLSDCVTILGPKMQLKIVRSSLVYAVHVSSILQFQCSGAILRTFPVSFVTCA